MKLPEIKKPDIKLPEFKKPDIKLKMPSLDFKLTEGMSSKLWTAGSLICIGCSGIALIIAMF